jgi:hypothetical protein
VSVSVYLQLEGNHESVAVLGSPQGWLSNVFT